MQIRTLETLVEIFTVKSFSKAAELQNLSLSALSMQMKALEEELGAALFDRSFRPPQFTPLGNAVVQQAKKVLFEQYQLINLCGADQPLTGNFRLGIIQSASVRILPNFFSRAETQAPKAKFEFTSGLSQNLSQAVLEGQLDAAIVTRVELDADSAGLRYDVIASEIMAVATPREYENAGLKELTDNLTFIHFTPTSGIGRLISRALEDIPLQPARTIILDSVEAAVGCVKADLGFTILPQNDILRYGEGEVSLRNIDSPTMVRDLAVVTRSDEHSDHWRNAMIDLIATPEITRL